MDSGGGMYDDDDVALSGIKLEILLEVRNRLLAE